MQAAASKAGLSPISIRVTIDGGVAYEGTANVSRPDVVSAGSAPNAKHGFLVSLPLPASGDKHTVDVFGLRAADGSAWRLDSSPRCVCAGHTCPCAHQEA